MSIAPASVAELRRQLHERASTPADRAFSMPGSFYTDPGYFQLEWETVLAGGWHCLGRADEVPEPGDFLTADVLDEPLLVTRGDDGVLRVLANVCRHRSMPVVAPAVASGNVRRFVCSYHGWSYDRSGGLVSAPRMDNPAFDPASCRLAELRSTVWHGFVYVCLGSDQPDPGEAKLGLDDLFTRYETGAFELVHQAEETWHCNWKTLVENFLEGYHLSIVHPRSRNWYTPTSLCRKALSDPDPASPATTPTTRTRSRPAASARPPSARSSGIGPSSWPPSRPTWSARRPTTWLACRSCRWPSTASG